MSIFDKVKEAALNQFIEVIEWLDESKDTILYRFPVVGQEIKNVAQLIVRLARHANAMADRLAGRLTAVGRPPAWPVEANLVFVAVPKVVEARLKAAGARYYVRQSASLAAPLASDHCLIRLVASFATREDEIDRFVELAAKA